MKPLCPNSDRNKSLLKESAMEIAMVGLGRMGGNMVTRLLRGGHSVFCYDTNQDVMNQYVSDGAISSSSLEDLVLKLSTPRKIWVMVPHGEATQTTITKLSNLLDPEDIIIDGGNNHYPDTIKLGKHLHDKQLRFLDVGTSGGIWGLQQGYSLMIGGEKTAFEHMTPIFESLAANGKSGYAYVGKTGAGHYLKMVHNGVEYALMESNAEGFELLDSSDEYDFNLEEVSEIWSNGSVIRSWLLDLIHQALKDDNKLTDIKPYVEDSGEGRWTVTESIRLGIPLPVITASLQQRFRSRQSEPFGAKLLAVMRNYFGGHAIHKN